MRFLRRLDDTGLSVLDVVVLRLRPDTDVRDLGEAMSILRRGAGHVAGLLVDVLHYGRTLATP